MDRTRQLVAVTALILVNSGCFGTTYLSRRQNDDAKWLETQTDRGATAADDAPETVDGNFDMEMSVHVAESDGRGNAHSPKERSNLPDLKLYVRIAGQVIQIGEAKNATVLLTHYPIRLKRSTTIEVRLVNEKKSGTRYGYDSRDANDWSHGSTDEEPLAQFSFPFEGPGRHYFHRGYGSFFVDIKPLQ